MAERKEDRIVIDFIDPLFAIVFHLNFVELKERPWFSNPRLLSHGEYIFELLILAICYSTVILSWVGYHRSTRAFPISVGRSAGRWRFGLDVLLLVAYFVLLVDYTNLRRELWVLVAIYLLFFLWDGLKRQEAIQAEHVETSDTVARRGSTVMWFFAFLLLAGFYQLMPPKAPLKEEDWIICLLAFTGTWLYRSHKERLWLRPVLLRLGRVWGFGGSTAKLRIYIAGPYTSQEDGGAEKNTRAAIDAGISVLHKGHVPFIPHLTHYVDLRAKESGISLAWEDYISWDMEWLRNCDALLFLGSSRGADMELHQARRLGKKVFLSLAEIPQLSPL